MAIRTMKLSQWKKATEAAYGKPAWDKLNGFSPGWVAAHLGISRQAVHQAIHRGDLDAVIVNRDTDGGLSMFMIPEASVAAFRTKREQRKAG